MLPRTDFAPLQSALYHSTRICLNLPFLVSSIERGPSFSEIKQSSEDNSKPQAARVRYLAESAKICKLSSESLVDILHRFRAQHTLANSPIILVYAAIIAANAVLVTLRHQHRSTNEPPLQIKDTALPALDTYLQELSVPWALAGEARIKFQRALSTLYRPGTTEAGQQVFSSEQWTNAPDQPTTTTNEPDTQQFMDLYPVDPALQTSMDQSQYHEQSWYTDPHHEHLQPQSSLPSDAATGTGSSPDVNFESPVPFVWDPMSVLDGEAALWAAIGGGGFPAGMDADFDAGGGGGGLEWAEQEPQPTSL